MLKQLPLNIFEKAINHYLLLDPLTPQRLSKLQGKAVAIEFKGLPLQLKLIILFSSQGLHILDNYQAPVDATIRGTVLSLAKMGLSSATKSESLFVGDVEIDGNVELGQDVKQFLDGIDIDWEEHLSRLIGDIAAHQVGNIVRQAKQWSEQAQETTRKNISEYVQEELRCFPTREEIDDFFADIDRIRCDVDRLEARLKRIKQ